MKVPITKANATMTAAIAATSKPYSTPDAPSSSRRRASTALKYSIMLGDLPDFPLSEALNGPRCQEERLPHRALVPTSRMRSDLGSASSHSRVHLLADGDSQRACAASRFRRFSGEHTQFQGCHQGLSTVLRAELLIQLHHVILGGRRADVELLGDHRHRMTLGQQLQHLLLAWAEPWPRRIQPSLHRAGQIVRGV